MKLIKAGEQAAFAVSLAPLLSACASHGDPSVAQQQMAKGFFWFSFFLALPLAVVITTWLGGKPAEVFSCEFERALFIAIIIAIMATVYLFIRFVVGIDIIT